MSVAHQVSIEEFEKMEPPEDGWLELVDGEVVHVTFPMPLHAWIASEVYDRLGPFVQQHDLGKVFPSVAGYVLSTEPPNLRGPDVSFIRKEKLGAFSRRANIPFAPDLAVEVVSPNDKAVEIRKKVDQFLAAGSRAVWVLYPETREVEVSEPGRRRLTLAGDDALEAPDLLPGFRVAVSELFPDIAYSPES